MATGGGGFDVSVSLGNSSGAFSAPTMYLVGGDSSSFIEYGRCNADGHLDLVVNKIGILPSQLQRIFVLLGTGNGTFSQAATYLFDAQQQPRRLAVADFNGDRRADVVTSNLNDGYISGHSTCLTPHHATTLMATGGVTSQSIAPPPASGKA